MKTSEEMARSVLGRAKAKRATQKRSFITGTLAFLCVCCIGAGAWMACRTTENPGEILQVQPTVTQPGTNVQLQPVKISLLSYAAEGENVVILKNGIKTPGQGQIRVKDIRGMTEDEIQAAYEAEKKYGRLVTEQMKEHFSEYSNRYGYGSNGLVSFISAGCLVIPIQDSSLVENVRVTVTGNGKLVNIDPLTEGGDKCPKEYIADSGDFRGGGAVMIWMLSEDMHWKLQNDPTIPLTSITSTITTTVNMKDGTQVTSVVDVSVDEEGFVYFTSRSETAL